MKKILAASALAVLSGCQSLSPVDEDWGWNYMRGSDYEYVYTDKGMRIATIGKNASGFCTVRAQSGWLKDKDQELNNELLLQLSTAARANCNPYRTSGYSTYEQKWLNESGYRALFGNM